MAGAAEGLVANMDYRFTAHAREEMKRRGIPEFLVHLVLTKPDQVADSGPDRQILQSLVEMDGKPFLLRVIVERDDPLIVVTVYRTSRINRYWRSEP